MSSPLRINRLVPAEGFPTKLYEEIYELVADRLSKNLYYPHFGSAWNALSYRHAGMYQIGKQFTSSLHEHGDGPTQPQRCDQEILLFGFFCNACSLFDCTFYGLFAVGACLDPKNFPLLTGVDQQSVNARSTRNAVAKSGLGSELVQACDDLFADPEYQELKDVRNILSHRAAPGRAYFMGAGSGSGVKQLAEWKLNDIRFEPQMTAVRKASAERLLSKLLVGGRSFVLNALMSAA